MLFRSAGPAGAGAGALTGVAEGAAVRSAAKGLVDKWVAKEAESLVAKGVAAETEKLVAQNMARNEAEILAKKKIADLGDKAIIEQATKNVTSNIGRNVGLTGFNEMMEVGGIYPEAVEEAQKQGKKDLSGSDLARVWEIGRAHV